MFRLVFGSRGIPINPVVSGKTPHVTPHVACGYTTDVHGLPLVGDPQLVTDPGHEPRDLASRIIKEKSPSCDATRAKARPVCSERDGLAKVIHLLEHRPVKVAEG